MMSITTKNTIVVMMIVRLRPDEDVFVAASTCVVVLVTTNDWG